MTSPNVALTRVTKRRRNKRWMRLPAFVAFVVLTSGVGWWFWERDLAGEAGSKLSTATVERRDFASSVLATGAVQAQVGAEVRVGARISGKVERLHANIGDAVTKGQVVAELEKADLEALAVMLISVRERTPEIGLRRAVGATRGDIRLQFLVESALLAGAGGVVGVFGGVTAALAVSRLGYWETVISWPAALVGFTFSVAVGLIFGIYPAVQAATLEPVEALRSE